MNIKLTGDEELDTAIEGLSAEITPPTDLWPAISAEIGDRARRRDRWADWRTVGIAATVVMAANVIVTLALIDGGDGSTNQLAFREPTISEHIQPVNYGSSVRLGPSYLQDRSDLRRRLDDSLDALDPEIRATIVADVEDLRAAQQQIAEALMENPDNTHLQRMLLGSLEDEVFLLSQIERLAAEQERRMDL